MKFIYRGYANILKCVVLVQSFYFVLKVERESSFLQLSSALKFALHCALLLKFKFILRKTESNLVELGMSVPSMRSSI